MDLGDGPNLISVVVVVLVALLMGFHSGAGVLAWLAVAGILIVFTLALTWIAAYSFAMVTYRRRIS